MNCHVLGLQTLVRFYSMKHTENMLSHPFSTDLGVPQKNNKINNKNILTAQLCKLNRMALPRSLAQSTERVWQWPRSQTSEQDTMSLNLGSATSYPQAVSLGRTSIEAILLMCIFLPAILFLK